MNLAIIFTVILEVLVFNDVFIYAMDEEFHLIDNRITYSSSKGEWEVALHQVRLVIEYVTEEGPFVEDHFLVLVDELMNEFHIPFSSDVVEKIFLTGMFGGEVESPFPSSSNFASRVLYPARLKGEKGYDLKTIPRNLVSKIFGLGQEAEMVLSEKLKETLNWGR